MNTRVTADDWTDLDSWWSSYLRTAPPIQENALLDSGAAQLSADWNHIDSWWAEYPTSSQLATASFSPAEYGSDQLSAHWRELDAWWETYTDTGFETAVAVAELLEQSNEAWANSEGPFDTDPLTADLTDARQLRGPLHPINEVEWSDWLARLLRPADALIADLFDERVTYPPETVLREEQLAKQDGSFRRPDLLLFCDDRGVSIEVKLDDENYRKTAETARLVERHYPNQEWTHFLLLPERKQGRLESIVKPPVVSEPSDYPRIEWENPGSIQVIHWREITSVIRTHLRQNNVPDDHWAANAYLFCAVAEQRLLNFQSQPEIERLADPSNAVEAFQPIKIATTLEEQLTYLRERPNL